MKNSRFANLILEHVRKKIKSGEITPLEAITVLGQALHATNEEICPTSRDIDLTLGILLLHDLLPDELKDLDKDSIDLRNFYESLDKVIDEIIKEFMPGFSRYVTVDELLRRLSERDEDEVLSVASELVEEDDVDWLTHELIKEYELLKPYEKLDAGHKTLAKVGRELAEEYARRHNIHGDVIVELDKLIDKMFNDLRSNPQAIQLLIDIMDARNGIWELRGLLLWDDTYSEYAKYLKPIEGFGRPFIYYEEPFYIYQKRIRDRLKEILPSLLLNA